MFTNSTGPVFHNPTPSNTNVTPNSSIPDIASDSSSSDSDSSISSDSDSDTDSCGDLPGIGPKALADKNPIANSLTHSSPRKLPPSIHIEFSRMEKAALKEYIYKLPTSAFPGLIEIIKSGLTEEEANNMGDEYELDIDTINLKTLREMQQYTYRILKLPLRINKPSNYINPSPLPAPSPVPSVISPPPHPVPSTPSVPFHKSPAQLLSVPSNNVKESPKSSSSYSSSPVPMSSISSSKSYTKRQEDLNFEFEFIPAHTAIANRRESYQSSSKSSIASSSVSRPTNSKKRPSSLDLLRESVNKRKKITHNNNHKNVNPNMESDAEIEDDKHSNYDDNSNDSEINDTHSSHHDKTFCSKCKQYVSPKHIVCPKCKCPLQRKCKTCNNFYNARSVCNQCNVTCQSCKRQIPIKIAKEVLKETDNITPCKDCDKLSRIHPEDCLVAFLPFDGKFYQCPDLLKSSPYNLDPVNCKAFISSMGGINKCAIFRIYKRENVSPTKTNSFVNWLKSPPELKKPIYYIDGDDLLRFCLVDGSIPALSKIEKTFEMPLIWGSRKPFMAQARRKANSTTPKSVKECNGRWMINETNLISMELHYKHNRPDNEILSTLYTEENKILIDSIFDIYNRDSNRFSDDQKFTTIQIDFKNGNKNVFFSGVTEYGLTRNLNPDSKKYIIGKPLNSDQLRWASLFGWNKRKKKQL